MPQTQQQQAGNRGQCSSRFLPLLLLLLPFTAQPSQAAIHIPSNCEYRLMLNTMDTLKQYQGKYVCYASNELGTAVSNEVILKTDVPPTQQKEKRVTVKSEQGSSIVLKCNPPQSSMKPIIHWMDWRLHYIQLSQRVVLGKDGNLYFAHLTPEDNRDDYTCHVQYLATRTILAKEAITLTVTPTDSVVQSKRPQMMRPTGTYSTYHALRGQTLELECIVQGLPTPDVSWLRRDGELSESRTTKDMFDRRLLFTNISESDGGEYQCKANNSQGKIIHTYNVIVEAAPYWTKEPVSQLYAPGETVRLDCQADGIPNPIISWTINGIPLSETDKDPRRTLTASGSLKLDDVNFGDTAIYQCRASNKHGTIITNANVYVVELPPRILTDNGNIYTFTEGQKALLECETFGSPKPKVVWETSSIPSFLGDPRVNLLTNGGLEIYNVTHDDEGVYNCSVQKTNLFISAELEVLNRTVIVSPPQALKVQPGHTAIFTCSALVDPKLDSPLIQWRKNNQKLFGSDNVRELTRRIMLHFTDNNDEAVYTCQVITKLDMAEASGTLTLYDRPDPPVLLQITDPRHRAVTLSWTPGDDHNSPVLEYVVEFEDQELKESGWEELKRVNGNKKHASLSLWPYMSYRFRVIAINDVGKSDPSKPSEIHNTLAEAPDNNPEDVKSESGDPHTLVITWQEMEKREFNGPDFKYRVMWRNVLGSGPNWHSNYTTTPSFIVNDVGNFSAFEIKVQAINEKGEGPQPDPVIGFSGEDVNLCVYFVCVTTGANEGKKVVSNLRPYSHYTLAATVFNGKGEGPASEMISFKTPEGVPGPPVSLMLDSPSETEMTLHWTPPEQPNGILIGYLLQYQQSDDDSPMQVETIDDPAVTHLTLRSLDHHSHYRFYLRGRTAAGDGEPIMREGATMLDGVPPANFSLSAGENSVNLSWVAKKRHRNFHNPEQQKRNKFTLCFLTEVQSSFATKGWFIGVVSAIVLLLLILLILCFIKRSKEGKYSVKDKEEGPMDSEAWPMKDETFGEYSDLEEKRTASQPSLCEESKLCSEDNLDFNGSSAITTEFNLDESLVSQFSRPSEGPEVLHALPDNSLLNSSTVSPATNGTPNSVAVLN
uniref:Neural cell adhesion molecule L1 n=1 Tax=Monopterus albus TaxID=43700 RepID=A0A3Q3K4I2_MONAL